MRMGSSDEALPPGFPGVARLEVDAPHRLSYWWIAVLKRGEDLLITIVLVLFTLPLLLLIAIAIKLESPGPVLFRQERYGLTEQRFKVLKFRTMYHQSRDDLCDRQTERNDERVTRVGACLRRHSLDELPQLFNVLAGDMSLVGPRPHAINTNLQGRMLENLVDGYALRHLVKPGITGWAQVNGWRGDIDTIEKLRQRVEHDLFYIANWSLMLDARIIAQTVARVWRDETAF
jgi:exopolysaccharide biosynthesis polyprenyl glycosylphosphotransferase